MGVRQVLGLDCKRVLSNHSQSVYLFEDGDLAGAQAQGERATGIPVFPNGETRLCARLGPS